MSGRRHYYNNWLGCVDGGLGVIHQESYWAQPQTPKDHLWRNLSCIHQKSKVHLRGSHADGLRQKKNEIARFSNFQDDCWLLFSRSSKDYFQDVQVPLSQFRSSRLALPTKARAEKAAAKAVAANFAKEAALKAAEDARKATQQFLQ